MLNARPIVVDDVDEVFNHTYRLAMRTGSTSSFVLTKDLLLSSLFGSNADWYGLVVTENQQVIGSCLYSFVNINRTFNLTKSLFLDILFVEPEYHGLGIGEMLIKHLERIAQVQGINRIEFWCMKDNIGAIEFYKKMGAKRIDLLDVYNITLKSDIINHD